jgi:hypothetical protein
MTTAPSCGRHTDTGQRCHEGPAGSPAPGAQRVEGVWYCSRHAPAAKARARKRRNQGYGLCSRKNCNRWAAEPNGLCVEHRAGERVAETRRTAA